MIKCEIHDYVEIACMYHYQVKLELNDAQSIQGKAITIMPNSEKQECLIISTNSGDQSIVLDTVKTMTAITQNAHFDCVKINS